MADRKCISKLLSYNDNVINVMPNKLNLHEVPFKYNIFFTNTIYIFMTT